MNTLILAHDPATGWEAQRHGPWAADKPEPTPLGLNGSPFAVVVGIIARIVPADVVITCPVVIPEL